MRTSAAVVVLGCLLALVTADLYRLHTAARDEADQQFRGLELLTADRTAALLKTELAAAAQALRVLAGSPDLARNPDLLDRALANDRGCAETFCVTGLAAIAADGTLQRSAGQAFSLPSPALDAALRWARDPRNGGAVRAASSRSPGPPGIVLITPLPAPGGAGPSGLLAARIALDARAGQGRDSGRPPFRMLVFGPDGSVVLHEHVARPTDRCVTCHESAGAVTRTIAASRGIVTYRVGGEERVAAVAPLEAEGGRWLVAIRVPRDRLARLSAGLQPLALLAAGLLLVAAAGGVLAWRAALGRVRAEDEALHRASLDRNGSELTELNERLKRAASDWRTTADTIDAALIVLEPNGVILRMNVAAAATLPDALPSWLGRPSSRLVEFPPWNNALALVARAADLQQVATERVRDSRNRTWDLWCRAMPDRRRPAVLVMARDVTNVVEMEESVRRSQTMAQLGAIVSGVAHEVRNPLFAISSLVDAWAIQSNRDPKPFVEALRREVGRLRTLMVDLLEYGRPGGTVARLPERLAAVIDGAIAACAHEAAARRVGVVASASADVWVVMDPRRFERVIVNLVLNAVQHAPADSVVRVETTESASSPSQVAITVRDCGPGFAPEDLPRIFTPFFSRRAGGFGLGLAITERIVTDHGGRIAAANDPAGGAVMTVWLPRAEAEQALAGREVECA